MNLLNNIHIIAIDRMDAVADEKSGSGVSVLFKDL